MWTRVLAGQVREPETTSMRTLGILKDLDETTARLFSRFCSAAVYLKDRGGFRIANPSKPYAVEAVEKEWEGVRFPSKFHFKDREPGKGLQRDAHINSQTRIAFVTDAENDYFKRDEQPGQMKLFQVVDGEFMPAKNWRSPTLFEGKFTLSMSLPPEAEIDDIMVYEAHVMDPSRIEPFVNRFMLAVKAKREAQPPTPKPPLPKPDKPGSDTGKDAQDDTRLAVPTPVEVWEKDWGTRDPVFDKFTAMWIKRPPGTDENSAVFGACLSGLHPHPLGLEWAQPGYRGARHGCSRPRRSPIPAFATRVPATFPR